MGKGAKARLTPATLTGGWLGERAWYTVAEVRRDLGLEADEVERNTCRVCGETIQMQIRRGTGFCSGRCEEGEREEQEAKALYATEASAREAGR